MWRKINSVFECLPLAARINGRIFCVHGGISPELNDLEMIRQIQRPMPVEDHGLVCDLLWSDPKSGVESFNENNRGVSVIYGEPALEQFMNNTNIDFVVRSHEIIPEGYQYFAG